MFDARSTSWLSHARSTDTKALRDAIEAGVEIKKGKPRADSFEMGTSEQILAAVYELLQQLVHVTARQKGKAKTTPWPRPVTAIDELEEQLAQVAYDDLMSDISFVTPEEFAALQAAIKPEDVLSRDTYAVGEQQQPEV